jgi:uncharacterized linocin/CFP29 family protein
MNHLLRDLAPLTDAAWAAIDQEANDHLRPVLGARRLVDFSGPHGWDYSATNLGRVTLLEGAAADGVTARQRRVLPLVELRADFAVSRSELTDLERGAVDLDFDELDDAARHIAIAENRIVFGGSEAAGITGIAQASPHAAVPLGDSCAAYPGLVARAVEVLLRAGIGGPYGIALAPEVYTNVVETTENGGYPLFDHLRQILGGPIVRTPGVDGAVVVSLRGEDFLFESGQDLSVGYDRTDDANVYLYLEETLSFRIATPEAAVTLPAAEVAAPSSRRLRRR